MMSKVHFIRRNTTAGAGGSDLDDADETTVNDKSTRDLGIFILQSLNTFKMFWTTFTVVSQGLEGW